MKQLSKFLLIILFLCATSCRAQKLVQKVSDAKKLQIQKNKFIGKPLKVLLAQIEPKIKFVFGNPENKWSFATGGTFLKFTFVDRDEYKTGRGKNEQPTGISVDFKLDPNNTHKPLPKEGLTSWTAENTKEYGDMIISRIYVSGEN